MTEKEKTLLAGCVKGDKAVWDALVLQYSKLAYSKIRKTFALHHALPQDNIVEDLYRTSFYPFVKMIFVNSANLRANEVVAWQVGSA
jgi:hypothetical protein